MKEGYAMERREEEKREPEAPEVRPEQPRLKRFRIVKLEERIAPLAGGGHTDSHPSYILSCI
jgi:hypothetical protein